MFTDLRLALDDDDILATAGEEVEKLAEVSYLSLVYTSSLRRN